MQECFFFFIFQSCDGVRLMTKISLMYSIFFNVEESGKYGKDLSAYLIDLEKVYYNGLFNFGGLCRRMALMESCYMPLRHFMVLTGVLWLSKWQTIKAFHIGVEFRKGCVLLLLFFTVYMNWINKCNQADEFATIGN